MCNQTLGNGLCGLKALRKKSNFQGCGSIFQEVGCQLRIYWICTKKSLGNRPFQNLGVDGKIILNLILEKEVVEREVERSERVAVLLKLRVL